jgi:predicted MFS family arabinose efflux permease
MWMIFLIEGLGAIWTRVIGMPSTAYGTLVAAVGCGNVIGSIVVGTWRKAPHPLGVILGSHTVFGLLTMINGLGSLGWMPRELVLYTGVWGLVGFANPFSTVSFSTLMQTETPEHLMSRVSGVVTAVQNAAILIAPMVGAWLAEWIGVSLVFVVSGAGLILYAIIMGIRLPLLLRRAKTVPAQRRHSLPL